MPNGYQRLRRIPLRGEAPAPAGWRLPLVGSLIGMAITAPALSRPYLQLAPRADASGALEAARAAAVVVATTLS